MGIDALERLLCRTPFLGRPYGKRAARIKRRFCLGLHRAGMLKPFAFVQWLATFACDLRCPYCEASAGKPAPDELDTREARNLVDDLADMGVRRLVISGGEPLLRGDLPEVMEHAARRGLRLGLVSNGERVASMWETLRRLPFFLYFTSIDGMEKAHDRFRGRPGTFGRTLEGLALFRKSGVPAILVNTVVHPGNVDQLVPLGKLLRDAGVGSWRLTPVARVGRAENQARYDLSREELRGLVRFIREHRGSMSVELGESHSYLGCFQGEVLGKPFFCGAGLTRCSVMPDGEVLGCHQVYDHSLSEGNVRERSFSEIWKEGFSRFRRAGVRESCRSCPYLDGCQGGCWAEMEKRGECLKAVWKGGRSEGDAFP